MKLTLKEAKEIIKNEINFHKDLLNEELKSNEIEDIEYKEGFISGLETALKLINSKNWKEL